MTSNRLIIFLILVGALACHKDSVKPSPTAQFSYAPTSTAGDIQFTNQSTNASSYSWNFGDGQMTADSAASPTHHYAKNGMYSVTLTAKNDYGTNQSSQNVPVTTAEGTLAFVASSLPYGALLIYVDGTYIGTVNTVATATPTCYAAGAVTASVSVGTNHSVRYKNASGSHDTTKNVKISTGGSCTVLAVS